MILFLFLLKVYPRTDCGVCRYEVEGENIKAGEFLQRYFAKCFAPSKGRNIPLLGNVTIVG